MESVVGLFKEPNQARAALHALQANGFERDHLGFSILDPIAELDIGSDTGVSSELGAPGGGAVVLRSAGLGALAGGVLTALFWVLLWAIPATRIYHEGGLIGVLFGLVGGAALGALFGALAGSDHGDYVKLLRQMGLPASIAERYYASLRAGNIMVIARDDGSNADAALRVMREHGALRLEDVASSGGELASERTVH
ncbi:hypothetical protein [Deinococcus maricopensis]|uniref:General stress protein 17M-like domain-containing protein n=1 Tax=Deinococcus maricopensis (strain DSM 21211 / LMG 22137 / NRRL B-23946 / LB-34) TaxID=709986 RepID=E8U7E8_DEIML|nr:hypothetical protein [Deinococcus maricopensis]ADV66987.1 hypothetical protein; putative membrane protein [Deinococcus maricopensis DSM 21211]